MAMFGAISYLSVGVFYLFFIVLLLTSWRGRLTGGFLIAACFFSIVWSFALAFQAWYGTLPSVLVLIVEVVRSGAWLTFLLALLAATGAPRYVRIITHAVWIGTLIAGVYVAIAVVNGTPTENAGYVLIRGGLLIALTGLILVEQLYRNSPPQSRWAIQYLALGVGGMFAYDLFLYAQGLLFDSLDPATWGARGLVNALFVPLIAIAARRNPQWDLDIFVSRHVVFYSTTLLAVGLYLLLMSLGGYFILIYGGSWGGIARIVFFIGAIIVLFVLLFSNRLRAKLKVFLSKHFFSNKYDYREEWLKLIGAMSSVESAGTRQIVVGALGQIVGSPGGYLWGLDRAAGCYRLIFSHDPGLGYDRIPLDDPLVEFMSERDWLVDLAEIEVKPDQYGPLRLPDWATAIEDAWLVIPLQNSNTLVGFVVLLKPAATFNLNYEDRDLLKTVGRHVGVQLAQDESDRLLAEAQQFDAYNRLTAFLMHDLKNLIAQQSLIVANAERHKRNPEFVDDAIATIANSVTRMNKLMEQLKRGDDDSGVRNVLLKYLVSGAVDRCSNAKPVPGIDVGDGELEVAVDSERFSMVLQHVIRNAQDATPADGTVDVKVSRSGEYGVVSVIDSGCGMAGDFVRDRLFKPFDSTKGSQGMGIGAHQAREFARKVGGDIRVESKTGIGTTFSILIPLA